MYTLGNGINHEININHTLFWYFSRIVYTTIILDMIHMCFFGITHAHLYFMICTCAFVLKKIIFCSLLSSVSYFDWFWLIFYNTWMLHQKCFWYGYYGDFWWLLVVVFATLRDNITHLYFHGIKWQFLYNMHHHIIIHKIDSTIVEFIWWNIIVDASIMVHPLEIIIAFFVGHHYILNSIKSTW